jgi:hypothetical protein
MEQQRRDDEIGQEISQLAALINANFRGSKREKAKLADRLTRVVSQASPQNVEPDSLARLQTWRERLQERRRECKSVSAALADIKAYLKYRPSKPIIEILQRYAAWLIDHWAVSSAGLGLIAAAIITVSYANYFVVFNVGPEEASFDSTRMLTGSLPGLLVLLVILTGLTTLLYLPLTAVNAAWRSRLVEGADGHQSSSDAKWFVAYALLALVGVVWLFASGTFFEILELLPGPNSASLAYLGAVYGALGGLIGGGFGTTFKACITAIRGRRKRLRPFILIEKEAVGGLVLGNLAAVLVLVLVFLPLAATDRALRVLDGAGVDSIEFLGLPLLDIRAVPVSVQKSPVMLSARAASCL